MRTRASRYDEEGLLRLLRLAVGDHPSGALGDVPAQVDDAEAEDRPDELSEAHVDAMERGPQWRAHIGATLKRMPETAAKLAAL